MKMLGIDDAGRGPVLGPMILAGILIDETDEEKLRNWNVKDSKKLTPIKREGIREKLVKNYSFAEEITTAEEIDSSTLAGTNLNQLEAIKSANIINHLVSETDEKEKIKVVIDCPSVNLKSWQAYLEEHIKKEVLEKIELFVEHKADVNHISCAAGSILAKTTRDEEVKKIKELVAEEIGKNVEIGSGYPSDATTINFIEKHYEEIKDLRIVRESWATFKNIMAKKEQKGLAEF
jgi:ribonuclease HII